MVARDSCGGTVDLWLCRVDCFERVAKEVRNLEFGLDDRNRKELAKYKI